MRTFSYADRDTTFPLGGIGTGTIGLNAGGVYSDFEIFNRPQRGNKLPYSFFSLHYNIGHLADTRVLESHGTSYFNKSCGFHPQEVHGLPSFSACQMSVKYPFVNLKFHDDSVPLDVKLTAFNPLLPLNVEDSGIPAIDSISIVKNNSNECANVLIAGSMPNFYGFRGYDCFGNYIVSSGTRNEVIYDKGVRGIWMTGEGLPNNDIRVAQGALMTDEENVQLQPYWYKGGWQDGITKFWKSMCQGKLDTNLDGQEIKTSAIGPEGLTVGSVGIEKSIEPGQIAQFHFVFSWYVPNRIKGWFNSETKNLTMRNAYAKRFENAWQVGKYLISQNKRLLETTRTFSNALYNSTLPQEVIDSAAYSLSALRSNTCFITEDGGFYGWEGCHEQEGSCHGTCTHVWNYAQTVAFLFPDLERFARRNEFLNESDSNGNISFRTQQSFGLPRFEMYPAADGQLGCVIRLWREYILSGDRKFLKELYPFARRAMEFAIKNWDKDGDGLLEASQHNTYDIEFIGVNPLTEVLYLAALRAMSSMANSLAYSDEANKYETSFKLFSDRFDKKCFNGEWYIQDCKLNEYSYQFASGCLSDQLFGQTLAVLYGLGDLLPNDHIKKTLRSIYKFNFSNGQEKHYCLQRSFIDPDEGGMFLCSWPKGNKPILPFVYSDEVWTGVEYQVATLMIAKGMINEALQIISSIRKRYDGKRRNPFNEMECGFHYARSMAAWGLIPALSGMIPHPDGSLTFNPLFSESDFHSFFCNGQSWGILHQTKDKCGHINQRIEIIETK